MAGVHGTKTGKKPELTPKKKPVPQPEVKAPEAMIEAMVGRMTGTRAKAEGTVASYKETARRFLKFIKNRTKFDTKDIDAYFAGRRKEGISERTLRKEFFQLKLFSQVNGVEWNFTKYDAPFTREQPKQPVLTPEQLEQMIRSHASLTEAERFYLAVCTTFACRREAMAQLNKRKIDTQTITIPGVHGGHTVKHLIPEVLLPVFENYHVKEHQVRALSLIFTKICRKSGLKLDKGFGWHSIRRCVSSMAEYFLPAAQLPPSAWADFTGWSKSAKGNQFMGAAMAGYYTHPEALNNDPYWMDRKIYAAHPLLKIWEEELKPKPVTKPVNKSVKK